jgi:hypothetical protein
MVDNSQHLFSRLLPLFRYPIVQLPIGILKLNVCLHPLGWHRFHFSLRPSDTPARIQLIRISQFEKKNCAWRRVPGTTPLGRAGQRFSYAAIAVASCPIFPYDFVKKSIDNPDHQLI